MLRIFPFSRSKMSSAPWPEASDQQKDSLSCMSEGQCHEGKTGYNDTSVSSCMSGSERSSEGWKSHDADYTVGSPQHSRSLYRLYGRGQGKYAGEDLSSKTTDSRNQRDLLSVLLLIIISISRMSIWDCKHLKVLPPKGGQKLRCSMRDVNMPFKGWNPDKRIERMKGTNGNCKQIVNSRRHT